MKFRMCRVVLCLFTVCAALTAWLAAQSPALADGRRAHLSRELADHVASRSAAPVDVIVHGTREEIEALAERHNLRVKRLMGSGAVLETNAAELDALSQDEAVDHVSRDAVVGSTMAVSNPAIGADQVWQGIAGIPGLTGAGIGVAVLDSGIAVQHQALRPAVAASVDFTGERRGHDPYGHGTHVAGIIGGRPGSVRHGTDQYSGVAPGVQLIDVRVLGADGSGLVSSVVEGIDWVIANRARYNIRVMNLSLGRPATESYLKDPMCEAVDRAIRAGIVVVVSAGNYGRDAQGRTVLASIVSPGITPGAITVGALATQGTVYRADDRVAAFSSRGPTLDLAMKPDLVAPGSRVGAPGAPGSYLVRAFPERQVAGEGAHGYLQLSGTSMSAAVVSGAAALLVDANPALRPWQVKLALQVTATFDAVVGLVGGGTGSLNVAGAVQVAREGLAGGLPATVIGGEPVTATGLAFEAIRRGNREILSDLSNLRSGQAIIWMNAIIWMGNSTPPGLPEADAIIWMNGLGMTDQPTSGTAIIWMSALQSRDISFAEAIIWMSGLPTGEVAPTSSPRRWTAALSSLQRLDNNAIIWMNSDQP